MSKEVEQLKEQNQSMQATIVTLECKALESSLRLRGVVEDTGGNIGELKVILEYLGEEPDEVRYNLDQIYRVNSKFAVQNQIPRDVVVQFSSKKKERRITYKNIQGPPRNRGGNHKSAEGIT